MFLANATDRTPVTWEIKSEVSNGDVALIASSPDFSKVSESAEKEIGKESPRHQRKRKSNPGFQKFVKNVNLKLFCSESP